jgi:AraC family transcriptional regulator, arabinose operon regulatory protein
MGGPLTLMDILPNRRAEHWTKDTGSRSEEAPMGAALEHQLTHHQSGHYRTMPSFVTTRPRPTDHLIIWVIRGGMDATIGDDTVHAAAGDLLVLDPGVPHRYRPGAHARWEWLWVHYGGVAAADLSRRIRTTPTPVVGFGADEHIRARFGELVTSGAAAAERRSDLRVDSCLYSLMGLMAERVERMAAGARLPQHGHLAGVHEFVNDRLAEPLTLDDLVEHTGFSRSHLTRLFHDQMGVSPMQYVTRQRMTRAATLLEVSTLNITEVARSVGYPDPYHFSRRFKHFTGYAPSHYRAVSRRAHA